jgi:hypothetical protein
MKTKIVRQGYAGARCFPALGTETGERERQLTADQRAAEKILALADRKAPALARWTGWGLDAHGRLGRLLEHRRQALAAEQRGEWRRADFYWWLAYRALRLLYGHPELWVDLASQAAAEGAQSLSNPDTLRARLLEELFIDAHCAVYNGREEQERNSGEDRSFVHGEYLRELLPLWDQTPAEKAAFFSPVVERWVQTLVARSDWTRALRYCRDVLRLFPDDVAAQNRWVGLHLQAAAAEESKGDDQWTARLEVAMNQRYIQELLPLCSGKSPNRLAFQAVGHLQHRRALCLVKTREIAQALEALEQSLTYHPQEPEAEQLRRELTLLMESLRSQVAALRGELAKNPTAQLNTDGEKLVTQVGLGASLAQRFAGSSEAQRVRSTLQRLSEESESRGAKPARRVRSPAAAKPAPPLLATPPHRAPNDREPGWEWWWSSRNLRIKLQAACALVLLVLAGFWAWQDGGRRTRRDAAYQRLVQASAAGDPLPVLVAATDFLAAPKRSGADLREGQVWDLYSRALARWSAGIVGQTGELNAEDLRRIEDYRRLSDARAR